MVKVPQKSTPYERKGKLIGGVVTLLFHLALLSIAFSAGLKSIYPPPEEIGILMEFEDEEIKPIEVKAVNEPSALNANKNNEIRLVQKSEGQLAAEQPGKGRESTMGDDGDVPVPEPERPKIDTRALFASADNKTDTLTAQTAETVSNALKAGNPQGNTGYGDLSGTPQARVKGRNLMGALPAPEYTVNNEGTVIVKIMVDQYGKVTNAIPGAAGTTVQDKVLWEAAKEAAYKARFNISSSAPSVQEGTITYIFKLR